MKKIFLMLILTIILCTASATIGFVFGRKNLSLLGYPEFDSFKPSPPNDKDISSADYYKQEVENYFSNAEGYIENAINYISRIENAIQKASDKAHSVIDEYNAWARAD